MWDAGASLFAAILFGWGALAAVRPASVLACAYGAGAGRPQPGRAALILTRLGGLLGMALAAYIMAAPPGNGLAAAPGGALSGPPHSTVTDLARLRGLSTSWPRATAA